MYLESIVKGMYRIAIPLPSFEYEIWDLLYIAEQYGQFKPPFGGVVCLDGINRDQVEFQKVFSLLNVLLISQINFTA